MKADARSIRAALDRPSPDVRLYLFHGPDEAGARDLAARLGAALGADAERVELDGAALRSDPTRLADEAASLSLFGGRRYIRVSPIGDESLEAVTLLLDAQRSEHPVVAIGPSLKGTSKLVKLALGHARAMSLALYVPEGAEAGRLAAEIGRDHGLRIDQELGRHIADAAGGDRAVMAREIEKLALYLDAAPDRPRTLDADSLESVGADLGEAEMGPAIDATLTGNDSALAAALSRLEQTGASPIPLLRGLVRRLIALADMQAQMAAGTSANVLIERVFFRDRPITSTALRRWSPERLDTAIAMARQAERSLTASGTAGDALAGAALVRIARLPGRNH